jgi:hypothetical protein
MRRKTASPKSATNKPDTPRVVGRHPRGEVPFFQSGGVWSALRGPHRVRAPRAADRRARCDKHANNFLRIEVDNLLHMLWDIESLPAAGALIAATTI